MVVSSVSEGVEKENPHLFQWKYKLVTRVLKNGLVAATRIPKVQFFEPAIPTNMHI